MGVAHAKLSPSASKRWIACPASVSLTAEIKRTSNPSARLGTFTHLVGEKLLLGEEVVSGQSLHCEWEEGMEWCNRDMLSEATNYYNYVKEIESRSKNAVLIVEKTVDISYIYPKSYLDEMDEAPTGHADAVVIEGNTLHIIDLKTGANLVEAFDNSQLKIYAYGVYLEYCFDYDITEIELHIVQNNARTGGDRTNSWVTTPEYIGSWVENKVIPSAQDALSDNPTCRAGEAQCQWCEAKTGCAEALRYANEVIGDLFDDVDDIPTNKKEVVEHTKTVSTENIVKFIETFSFLKGLNDAYEEKLRTDMVNGLEVAGYKLVKGVKHKKWKDEIEAYNKLKSWCALDDVAPRKLVTPSQAEKVIGEMTSKKRNIFNELWVKPQGELVVAPTSDKRPAEKPISQLFDDADDDDLSFLD